MAYSQKVRLTAICDIQSGYTARAAMKDTPQGGVPTVQLRDLQGEGDFDPSNAPTYLLAPSFDRYWARAGDVLFRSRGDRNTAVVVAPETNKAAVAILPLIILRPERDAVDPRYLAWFINQSATQRYFDACSHGSAMRMIPKAAIDNLEVDLPNLPTQKLIVEIDTLARLENVLTTQLADKKLELTKFALLRRARNAQLHGNGAGRVETRQISKPRGHD